jgi:hypothetical protein
MNDEKNINEFRETDRNCGKTRTSNDCIFELIAKRDTTLGGLSLPGSPAAFPSPWIKASGFASHPFEWFALASFFIRRLARLNISVEIREADLTGFHRFPQINNSYVIFCSCTLCGLWIIMFLIC